MLGLGIAAGRGRRIGGSGAPGPWSPTNLALEWIDPTRPETVVASPYRVASPNPALASYSRATASKRPSYASNRLTFDGTDDGLLQMAPATLIASTTLPDIASSVPGKGPTCTGLARDGDGSWWVGDHGTETTGESDATRDAGIIHYSSDFSTVLGRIRFADLGLAQSSVQGVCIDAANGSLWIACPLQGTAPVGRVYNISTAGALLATLSTGTVAGANGIAYDSILGCLIVMTMGGAATWINKSTGASIKTRTFPADGGSATADMLFFDGSGGGEGVIYVSTGVSGEWGSVIKFDVATNCPQRQWQFPDVLAIEGIWIAGGTIWIGNDDFYHNAARTNAIVSYAISTATAAVGTRLIMAGWCARRHRPRPRP